MGKVCTSHLMPVSCTDPPSATSYTSVRVRNVVCTNCRAPYNINYQWTLRRTMNKKDLQSTRSYKEKILKDLPEI